MLFQEVTLIILSSNYINNSMIAKNPNIEIVDDYQATITRLMIVSLKCFMSQAF